MIDARNPTEPHACVERPDSLMEAILAIEGIRDAVVVLNGPTGCKVFYGWLSDQQYPRADHLDVARHFKEFYFGQSRIPCTYLDEQDYFVYFPLGFANESSFKGALLIQDHALLV